MPRFVQDASIHVKNTLLVKDIAARFADGRLSAAKLAAWNEDEVAQNLIAVRGIGPVGASIAFSYGAEC
jgi:DNA-3-methyladenine glycosylase II